MAEDICRIGVAMTGSRGDPDVAAEVLALAASIYPDRRVEIHFHPNSFLVAGHFAGEDAARADAFVDIANDPGFDALWFGRGGYGACRLVELVMPRLKPEAKAKAYLGYSDAGSLLAALYHQAFDKVAHGPMPQDLKRTGGQAAIRRALSWLVDRDAGALEAGLDRTRPNAAFNITILSHLIGTPWQPDLSGHVLLLEEVSEHMYRMDRALCHITSNAGIRQAAGVRLGRCSDIPFNDPDFGQTEEEVARYWCERAGLQWLGRADIGHDADNKVVPFGRLPVG